MELKDFIKSIEVFAPVLASYMLGPIGSLIAHLIIPRLSGCDELGKLNNLSFTIDDIKKLVEAEKVLIQTVNPTSAE